MQKKVMKMKNKRVGVGPREFGMELCFSPHHQTHHPLRHRPFQRATYSLGVQVESCELRTTLSYIANIPSIPNAEGNMHLQTKLHKSCKKNKIA